MKRRLSQKLSIARSPFSKSFGVIFHASRSPNTLPLSFIKKALLEGHAFRTLVRTGLFLIRHFMHKLLSLRPPCILVHYVVYTTATQFQFFPESQLVSFSSFSCAKILILVLFSPLRKKGHNARNPSIASLGRYAFRRAAPRSRKFPINLPIYDTSSTW